MATRLFLNAIMEAKLLAAGKKRDFDPSAKAIDATSSFNTEQDESTLCMSSY